MDLRAQTINGIKWTVGSSFLQKAISFVTTIVIARHLGPSVYGLFAFAMVVVASFELFKSMGIDAALIRMKGDFKKAANTAFFIIPVLGITLYLLLNLSAPIIGRFLNSQELVPVTRVLGIIFVLSSFSRVPAALLERSMQFKKISLADSVSMLVFSISAIMFTFLNIGIWTLVFAYILKTAVYMIMVWIYAGWKPKFEFDGKLAWEMFHFGKFIFMSLALWFVKMNLDNLLVGKLLGATMLGFYAIAFNIANFGADYFGQQVQRVTYPAYSRLQDDLPELKNAFLKVLKYVSLVAFPLGIGVYLLGREFLTLAYGHKWEGAINIVKVLSLAGIFNTLPACIGGVFLACGRSKLGLLMASIQVGLFLVFIAPFAKAMGLIGVAWVVSGASFIAFIFYLYYVIKILSVSFNEIVDSLKPTIIPSLVMTLSIVMFKFIFIRQDYIFMGNYIFIFMFILAILAYILTIIKNEKALVADIKEMIL